MVDIRYQVEVLFEYLAKFPIRKRQEALYLWLRSKDFSLKDRTLLFMEYSSLFVEGYPRPEDILQDLVSVE